ncbi:MAG: helix-turn-helix transcriptional regulator [Bacteroidia bacterium]
MNRIDRVTAILIQLQSKKVVKAQEIADRFNVSLRTVYRDVRTLEEAGIPLIGETGVGYSIMDGYKLPPVMFTLEEATAFLTAEKLIEKLTDASTEESYKSAMYKVKAVLRATEKNYLEHMDDSIEVIGNPYLPEAKNSVNPLQTILKSISEKKVLSIQYFANHSQEHTTRLVEPIGIFYAGSKWHMIAYCRLRNDYRDFRLDRISQIRPGDERIDKQHPSLKTFIKQFSKEQSLHEVVMRMDKSAYKHLGDQKYYNGFVSQQESGDTIELFFLTWSLEGFARWYMMFGDVAEIISPASLKARVKELAGLISEKMR